MASRSAAGAAGIARTAINLAPVGRNRLRQINALGTPPAAVRSLLRDTEEQVREVKRDIGKMIRISTPTRVTSTYGITDQ